MRIRYKVALVGIIPITVAAAIALIAWLLLDQAERARSGATLAGAAFRDLVEVVGAKESFIRGQPSERERQAQRFDEAATRARALLDQLEASPARTGSGRRRRCPPFARRIRGRDGPAPGTDPGERWKVAELNARTASLVI
jgi:hypothetical protein